MLENIGFKAALRQKSVRLLQCLRLLSFRLFCYIALLSLFTFLPFLILTAGDDFIVSGKCLKFSGFTPIQPQNVTKIEKLLLAPLAITSLFKTEHLLAIAKIT